LHLGCLVAQVVKLTICFTALTIVFCKSTEESNSAENYLEPSPIVTGIVVVVDPKAVAWAIGVVLAASCCFPMAVRWATVPI